MPGTFSVPERRPNSCPPPCSVGMSCYAAAHVERAETLRAVHLVRRHRHHVDRQLLNVHLYMSRGLHAVRVEHDAVRAADFAEGADGLYRSYLVVRRHNRRENRVGADSLFELLRRHHAAAVDRQNRVLEAHLSSHLTVSRIAWCSIALVIMWFPLPRSRSAHAAPLIARLSASLPAPVKIISVGSAFISAATFARAASTASRASRPSLCRLFGLP